MAVKKEILSDAERTKRIREAAREHDTSNDPASFDLVFDKVVKSPPEGQQFKPKGRRLIGGNDV